MNKGTRKETNVYNTHCILLCILFLWDPGYFHHYMALKILNIKQEKQDNSLFEVLTAHVDNEALTYERGPKYTWLHF